MKSDRPQGQGFSQGSQRSGGQTRSEAICLTPSRLHLLQARKRVTAQSWQQPFVSRFSRSSFAGDFPSFSKDVGRLQKFRKNSFLDQKSLFLLTHRSSRYISIGHLGILWNKKKPKFSKARWTC